MGESEIILFVILVSCFVVILGIYFNKYFNEDFKLLICFFGIYNVKLIEF